MPSTAMKVVMTLVTLASLVGALLLQLSAKRLRRRASACDAIVADRLENRAEMDDQLGKACFAVAATTGVFAVAL